MCVCVSLRDVFSPRLFFSYSYLYQVSHHILPQTHPQEPGSNAPVCRRLGGSEGRVCLSPSLGLLCLLPLGCCRFVPPCQAVAWHLLGAQGMLTEWWLCSLEHLEHLGQSERRARTAIGEDVGGVRVALRLAWWLTVLAAGLSWHSVSPRLRIFVGFCCFFSFLCSYSKLGS